jgi:hypothetical protein
MPNVTAGSQYEPLPAGFCAPTRNTIAALIDEEFGPAPREDRISRPIKDERWLASWDDGLMPLATAEKATSNTSMSGMTNNTSSMEQRYRAMEQNYVPTSPSFGSGGRLTPMAPAARQYPPPSLSFGEAREPSPMSIARRSNSVDDGVGSNAAGADRTSVIDFAEEYEARDPESFYEAYNRAIDAARTVCMLAKRTPDLNLAERRMDYLNGGLIDVMNEEYESVNELRAQMPDA